MNPFDEQRKTARLVASLRDPARFDYQTSDITCVETHLSYVLLTGRYAFKIKKPLDLGFADFSTLQKRRFCCEEEVRLNRRLAPELYLGVVPIAGTENAPSFAPAGPAIEYAVKMLQFPQPMQLDRVLERGQLRPEQLDQLARDIAAFHARAAIAPGNGEFGMPEGIYYCARDNFTQLQPLLENGKELSRLEILRAWTSDEWRQRQDDLLQRKLGGFVRECHGDMHLANMVLLDGRIVVFDCIEFSPVLRWIDVLSEIAFLVMDLHDRAAPQHAWRVLNLYLEHTGDYAGLSVLRYYLVYRAMVRAKVAALRATQTCVAEHVHALAECGDYLRLASDFTRPTRPAVMITHGLSGSGKSSVAGVLSERLGAIRLRSDVERKRLYGLRAAQGSASGLDAGIYTADAGERTYQRLAVLARAIVEAGFSVIVDATFLMHSQRAAFHALARELNAAFLILDCRAAESTLRRRVAERSARGGDPSEADDRVLVRQLAAQEALVPDELRVVVNVDCERPVAIDAVLSALDKRGIVD